MADFKTAEEQCLILQKVIDEWESTIHGKVDMIVCTPKTKELIKDIDIVKKIKIVSDSRLEDGVVYLVPVGKSFPPYIEYGQSDFKEELK